MINEPIKLVGYWNGSEADPKIIFDIPSSDSTKDYKLVVITLEIPNETTEELKSTDYSRVSRELRNVVQSAERALNSLKWRK